MGKTNGFREVMSAVRGYMPGLVATSALINLLMLVTAIYMLQVYDRVLASGSLDTLLWLSLIAIFAIVIYGILEWSRRVMLSRSGTYIENRLTAPVLRQLIRNQLKDGGSGAGIRDITDLRSFYQGDAVLSFFDAPWSIVFIAFVALLHPLLGLIALGGVIALFATTVLNDLLTRRRQKDVASAVRSSHEAAVRYIDGAETISTLGMSNAVIERWRQIKETARADEKHLQETTTAILSFSRALRFALQIMLLGAGAYLVLAGQITPGAMIAGSIIGGRAFAPIERVTAGWRRWVAAQAARRRLSALFAEMKPTGQALKLPQPKGALSVEHLVFKPEGLSKPILGDVTFAVKPGEACAVVGPSGAGKSTLCRMIVGAWKPNSGNVRLDGADICDWDPDELGPNIGYLPQKVELFPGTVAENIARLGKLDSERVVSAAKIAGVHDLILRLPDGYETKVGGGSDVISLGQKQRIGLARAAYGNPALVVLDEPNSNLDQDGDSALIGAIGAMRKAGKTVIVVSHRAAILNVMDKVLLLRDGAVSKFGDRDEFLKPTRRADAVASGASDGTPRRAHGSHVVGQPSGV